MERLGAYNRIIGVLALQGDFAAHCRVLSNHLKFPALLVRTPHDLNGVDALIIPGGESTTIAKLLQRIGLDEAIRSRAAAGMPVYGTCAGMILMSRCVDERPEQPTLGLMDIDTRRNAFGRQIDSFEADVPLVAGTLPAEDAPGSDGELSAPQCVRGVFIRAPYVIRAGGGVKILGSYQDRIVAARQSNLLATAFHPELTDDPRIHILFADMVVNSQEER